MSNTAWPPNPEWVTPIPASPDPVRAPGQPPIDEPPLYRDVTPRLIKVPNPGANTEISVKVEGGFIWHLQAVSFTFTTSAAVATRGVALQAFDGSDVVWQVFAPASQVASIAGQYSLLRGFGGTSNIAAINRQAGTLPPIPVLGGQVLRTSTLALDVADAYTLITLYVYQIEWRKMLGGDAHPLNSETWRRQYTSGLLREID